MARASDTIAVICALGFVPCTHVSFFCVSSLDFRVGLFRDHFVISKLGEATISPLLDSRLQAFADTSSLVFRWSFGCVLFLLRCNIHLLPALCPAWPYDWVLHGVYACVAMDFLLSRLSGLPDRPGYRHPSQPLIGGIGIDVTPKSHGHHILSLIHI